MADPWAEFSPSGAAADAATDPWADFKPAEVASEKPAAAGWGATAKDVAKQGLSGLAEVPEMLASGPAQLLGLAGRAANYLIPSGRFNDPEAAANQQKLRELAEPGKGIGQYLPEATTPEGKIARTATGFAGSLAAGGLGPAGAAKGVLPYLAREAGPAARMAGIGAATGAASEMAGMATEGTPFEAAARMGTALAGPAMAQKAGRAFSYRGSPTQQALEDSVNARYAEARGLGVELNPTSVSKAILDIKKGIEVHPDNAEKTFKFLNSAQSEHAPIAPKTTAEQLGLVEPAQKQGVTFDKLESLRRDLGDVAIAGGSDAKAAREAQRGIDNFLASVTPKDVIKGDAGKLAEIAQQARGDAAANFRMKAMDALRQRAEDTAKTGQSAERAFRNQLKAFVRPNNKGISPASREGFTKQEIAELRKASHMTSVDAMLRTAGIAGGYLGMAGLGGATYFTHDPEYAGAAAIGYGARKLGGIRARMGANRLGRMTASRSPLARETGVTMPTSPLNPWATRGALGRAVINNAEGFKKGGRVTKTFRYADGGEVDPNAPPDPSAGQTIGQIFDVANSGNPLSGQLTDAQYWSQPATPEMQQYVVDHGGRYTPQQMSSGEDGGWFQGDASRQNSGDPGFNSQVATGITRGMFPGWQGMPNFSAPSTNNPRLLPPGYNSGNYVMRNGEIIDRRILGNPASWFNWAGGGDLYRIGGPFPINVSGSYAGHGPASGGWPGSTQGLHLTSKTQWIKRGGRIKGLPKVPR